MKKLLMIILLCTGLSAMSQDATVYNVYKTQLLEYSAYRDKWIEVGEPSFVDIDITFKGNHMLINAKSPTSFRLDANNSQDFGNENFKGRRYPAIEFVNNQRCNVDIVKYTNTDVAIINIIYLDQTPRFWLMYYIRTN